VRSVVKRWGTLPFETLVSLLAFLTGLFALVGVGGIGLGALQSLIPSWMFYTIETLYMLSGLMMFLGIGMGKAMFESPGLVLIMMGSAIRAFASGLFIPEVGLSAVLISIMFQVLVIGAASIRLHSIARREVIVRANGPG
jgi:hypothetical protein